MAKKGERKSKLLEEAIDASIEFEELMDKTDFDSWLKDDKSDELVKQGQDVAPFKKYEENIKNLDNIYDRMKLNGANKSPKLEDKFSLEKYLIYNLFKAKNIRRDARICSNKNDEQEKYKEALHYLLSALNEHNKFCLQMKQNGSNKSLNTCEDNALNRWLILLYNDLSICYAGLDNSSMSRGYAEEASKIIKKEERNLFGWDKIPGDDNVRLITFLKDNYRIKWVNTANGKQNIYEKSYKEFEKKLSADNSKNLKDIEYLYFVSSKLYDLYIVALFNQAEAERRSHQNTEAERNFKKIIKYAERKTKDKKVTPLRNFNYYSAILNLSDLYMDQGRGREALELLKKVINEENIEKENDIRYWNAYITKINALIDQSKYDDAEEILKKKFCEKGNNFTLVKRHRITSTGFKAINCYARCKIEKLRNTLKIDKNKKDGELKKAETVINDNIQIIIDREQKGLETKVYKQLSDI